MHILHVHTIPTLMMITWKTEVFTLSLAWNWCSLQCVASQPLSNFIASTLPWSIKIIIALHSCCPLHRMPHTVLNCLYDHKEKVNCFVSFAYSHTSWYKCKMRLQFGKETQVWEWDYSLAERHGSGNEAKVSLLIRDCLRVWGSTIPSASACSQVGAWLLGLWLYYFSLQGR